jgi:hypothetical protein
MIEFRFIGKFRRTRYMSAGSQHFNGCSSNFNLPNLVSGRSFHPGLRLRMLVKHSTDLLVTRACVTESHPGRHGRYLIRASDEKATPYLGFRGYRPPDALYRRGSTSVVRYRCSRKPMLKPDCALKLVQLSCPRVERNVEHRTAVLAFRYETMFEAIRTLSPQVENMANMWCLCPINSTRTTISTMDI